MKFRLPKQILLGFLGLLQATHVLAAAGSESPIVNLTLADGLAGEVVHRVVTDHNGLVWVATNNGINLYNGKRLIHFPLAAEGGWPVVVYDLCETRDNSIYAATDAGLYRLALGGGRFEHILPEITKPSSLLAVGDTVYIGGQQGFMFFDGERLNHKDVGAVGKGLDNIVRQYTAAPDGMVWFLTRFNLGCYNPATGKTEMHLLKGLLPDRTPLTQFAHLGEQFFIGTTKEGLYVYNRHTRQARKLEEIGNVVKTVQLSRDSLVCVATDGAGAYLLDPRTLAVVKHYSEESPDDLRIPTNAVYCFYRDANGVDWFGLMRYGLAYTRHSVDMFQSYVCGGFSTEGINVRSYFFRGNESLIGTHQGFWFLDKTRGINRHFTPEQLGGGHIVTGIAWQNGCYFIGTYDGGLRVLNPQTMTIGRFNSIPLLDHAIIADIQTGKDGSIWIGSGEGLFIIEKDGSVKRYCEQNSHIVAGVINSITFDNRGNAWLTGASGVSIYSATSGEVLEVTFPKGSFFERIPYLRGETGHGNLMFMRSGPRMYYTTTDRSKFGEMALPPALNGSWFRGFVDDREGHYWIGTEKGLYRVGYDDDSVLHFGYSEGLHGELINAMSYADGKLWTATSMGLFSLDTKQLEEWRNIVRYHPILHDICKGTDYLDGAAERNVNATGELRLSWNLGSEVLYAGVTIPDYTLQTGRLFEYRIDGGPWQTIHNEQKMDIRGLSLGSHTLETRLSGIGGSSSKYTLTVYPSGWALMEAMVLLTFIVLLWIWYRYRKNTKVLLAERQGIEEALLESEALREEVEEPQEPQKYQKVKLDEQECEEIVTRMRTLLDTQRLYTNPELKRTDLAERLHVSPVKLSQIFTQYLKENYYEFVNRYRLEEFKRLIEADDYKRYTITALSERCGFKKTSFFTTFRKVEGMTPAEYLKARHIQARF